MLNYLSSSVIYITVVYSCYIVKFLRRGSYPWKQEELSLLQQSQLGRRKGVVRYSFKYANFEQTKRVQSVVDSQGLKANNIVSTK